MCKNVDTESIQHELRDAILSGKVPSNLGVLSTMAKFKEYFGSEFITPHTNSSWLRLITQYAPYLNHVSLKQGCSRDSQYLYFPENYDLFPKTLVFLKDFARTQKGSLQRVIFARLLPNAEVLPHKDGGEYFKYRDRYHLVIESKEGSEFTCGNEQQIFREGELWWFANKEIHSVKNLSDTPRLHIIFDLLPNDVFTWRGKLHYTFFSFFFQNYQDQFGVEKFNELIETNSYARDILLSGPERQWLRRKYQHLHIQSETK